MHAKWNGTNLNKPAASRCISAKAWTLNNMCLTRGRPKKKVTQRSLDGTFLKEYANIHDAAVV